MPEVKKPGAAAPKKSEWGASQPGTNPGDEWGEDNPGNAHGVGVDDHVFFHRDGHGPHSGQVIAHGVHGCTVKDDGGAKHKVKWARVHGLKKRAVHPMKVVDQGEAGAIVEHEDGRRVFVAGQLPLEEGQHKFSDLAGLENKGRQAKAPKISDLEPFARAAKGDDLAKADHDCEGPALCRLCQERAVEDAADLVKSFGDDGASIAALEAAVARLRSSSTTAPRPRSLGAGSRPLPLLLKRQD